MLLVINTLRFQFKQIPVIAIVLAISALFMLPGCANNEQVAPIYSSIGEIPIEVAIDQIYTDYIEDESNANEKYKGKRLLFYGIIVEKVGRIFNWGNNEVYLGNSHITTGNIQFNPRYAVDLDNIMEGFVVDIIGECEGLKKYLWGEPILQINDCWIGIVKGDSEAVFESEQY